MQYVLTQTEYDDLNNAAFKAGEKVKENMQRLCTLAADNVPVDWGWNQTGHDEPDDPVGTKENPKPWGCLITVEKEHEWYCDNCPVQNICPYQFKNYSK
jgi:hypothetical protein